MEEEKDVVIMMVLVAVVMVVVPIVFELILTPRHVQCHLSSMAATREEIRRQSLARSRGGPSLKAQENELYESPDPMTDAERSALESETGTAT